MEVENLISELEAVPRALLEPARKLLTEARLAGLIDQADLETRAHHLAASLEGITRAESGVAEVLRQLRLLAQQGQAVEPDALEMLVRNGWEVWLRANQAMEEVLYGLLKGLITDARGTPEWNSGWADQFSPYEIDVLDLLDEEVAVAERIAADEVRPVRAPERFSSLLPLLRFGLGKSTQEVSELLHIDDANGGHMAEYQYHNQVGRLTERLLKRVVEKEITSLGWVLAQSPFLSSTSVHGEANSESNPGIDAGNVSSWRPDLLATTEDQLDICMELKYFGRPGRRPNPQKPRVRSQNPPESLKNARGLVIERMYGWSVKHLPKVLVEISHHSMEPIYWLVPGTLEDGAEEPFDSLKSAVDRWKSKGLSEPISS